MADSKLVNKILKSREDRWLKQEEIIKRYPFSLISFTLNIPGKIKANDLFRRIHNEGIVAIEKLIETKCLEVINKEIMHKNTGSEGFLSIDMNPILLKKSLIIIEENHPLGRIFDIDVFDSNHNQISRNDIDKPPRKCFICEDEAIQCIKSHKHTNEELIEKIHSKTIGYFR